ncbi:MAG: trypsin-like serine peptidase [Frankiaceae bacterium]
MTFPRARWARSTLVGGLATALATLTFVAPAHAVILPGTSNDLKPMPGTASGALPYSAVVEIDLGPGYTLDGKILGRCTGWMYASNMVATAGHCIYDETKVTGGYKISQMTVTPGINGTYKPFQTCGVVNAYVPPEWTQGQSRTQEGNPYWDYGALKLNCTVGDKTGLLKYGAAPNVGWPTRVVGYPHRSADPALYPDHSQWYSDDQVRAFNGYQVFYANDTEQRMSGAPVMQWDGYRNEWNVVAIHHGGADDPNYNVGTRIAPIVVSDLQYWQNYG